MVHAHSGLRWVVIILLLLAIVKAFAGRSKSEYKEGDRKVFLFAMISFHLQFVIGLVLYFQSNKFAFDGELMKNAVSRFYGVEHLVGMLIAFVLITMGYSKSKKLIEAGRKYKTVLIYYSLAFIVVLLSIPWPFRALGGHWF